MVKAWKKYVDKHPLKNELFAIIERLSRSDFVGLDIRPVIGHRGKYRLRKGKIRIIFSRIDGEVAIEAVDGRGDIYKQL